MSGLTPAMYPPRRGARPRRRAPGASGAGTRGHGNGACSAIAWRRLGPSIRSVTTNTLRSSSPKSRTCSRLGCDTCSVRPSSRKRARTTSQCGWSSRLQHADRDRDAQRAVRALEHQAARGGRARASGRARSAPAGPASAARRPAAWVASRRRAGTRAPPVEARRGRCRVGQRSAGSFASARSTTSSRRGRSLRRSVGLIGRSVSTWLSSVT